MKKNRLYKTLYKYVWTKTNESKTQLITSILERENGSNEYYSKQHRQANIWTTSKGLNEFVFFLWVTAKKKRESLYDVYVYWVVEMLFILRMYKMHSNP